MENKTILPNFFIVGAAKSGTTSLVEYINQHPDVFISSIKEPFFYVQGFGLEDKEEYLKLFVEGNKCKAVGEATTGYLFDGLAPELIKEDYPDAKIIIMLREPVSMAFSFWRYMCVTGNENKSFEEAISVQETAYRKGEKFIKECAGWWANYIYLERAKYFEQVKRYWEIFGQEKIRVYLFEDFVKDPKLICHDIFDFLQVDTTFKPDCFKVVNQGGVVRYSFIRNLRNRRYPLLKALLPYKFRSWVRVTTRKFNIKQVSKQEYQLPTHVKKELKNKFRQDIFFLEKLISKDLGCWYNDSV